TRLKVLCESVIYARSFLRIVSSLRRAALPVSSQRRIVDATSQSVNRAMLASAALASHTKVRHQSPFSPAASPKASGPFCFVERLGTIGKPEKGEFVWRLLFP